MLKYSELKNVKFSVGNSNGMYLSIYLYSKIICFLIMAISICHLSNLSNLYLFIRYSNNIKQDKHC